MSLKILLIVVAITIVFQIGILFLCKWNRKISRVIECKYNNKYNKRIILAVLIMITIVIFILLLHSYAVTIIAIKKYL